MSKHLPNCPHLSEYDGLGDAGILMALNKKWGDRTPADIRRERSNIDEIDRKIDKMLDDLQYSRDHNLPYVMSKPDVHNIIMDKKLYESKMKKAYIEGYNQGKEDTNKGIVRDPLDVWSQYWNKNN